MQRLKFINAKIIIKNMSSPWCHHKIKFLVRQGGTTYVVASYICWARTGWSETAGPCVRSLSSLLLRSCFALALASCFFLTSHQLLAACWLAGCLMHAALLFGCFANYIQLLIHTTSRCIIYHSASHQLVVWCWYYRLAYVVGATRSEWGKDLTWLHDERASECVHVLTVGASTYLRRGS